jgi:hypothetical protein
MPRHYLAFSLLLPLCGGLAAGAETRAFPVGSSDSLAAVVSQIRDLRSHGKLLPDQPVAIQLSGGTQILSDTLALNASVSGVGTNSLVIEAAPGQHPVLSGGVTITNWRKAAGEIPGLPAVARGQVWLADAPTVSGRRFEVRQLWIDGVKAVRARHPNPDELERLTAWDKTNQVAVIPAAALAGVRAANGVEMIVDQVWEIARLRINTTRIEGSNASLTFRQPESKLEFEHPWPPVTVNAKYRAPFYLENAPEFLDSPGEWFEDLKAGKIYYWPRAGENLAGAEVVAPVLETLVSLEGSLDHPVSNIVFRGITFAYATWRRPSEQGHVPLQAGMFLLDAHKLSPKGMPYSPKLDNVAHVGRPPAAVRVSNASHISFVDCVFEHTAGAGLDFVTGTHDDLVEGCVFRDIGGNGLQLGEFSPTNVEVHVPWLPADEREICTRDLIAGNVISQCGTEDWGCVGVAAGYVRDLRLEHNDVSDLPYSGISLGWGWTKSPNAMRNNLIFANHIHEVGKRLGDLGGVYVLSAQPGTVVSENVIEDIHPSRWVPDPEHWFYLYLDEGSSFITVRDNWCPAEKFLRNANGPGNVWTNNGPQVSEIIKHHAGTNGFAPLSPAH